MKLHILCLFLLLPTAPLASDGVLEINQSCAESPSGCFAGDTEGFPVQISISGSYRLTGPLTLPNDTSGIEVAASDVTLDLNGFSIECPGCEAGIGPGSGIENPAGTTIDFSNVVVRNGTVRNVRRHGISLQRTSAVQIDRVHVLEVEFSGIVLAASTGGVVTNGCTVTHSVVQGASGSGISGCNEGGVYTGNRVGAIAGSGTGLSGGSSCVMTGNVVSDTSSLAFSGIGCSVEANSAFRAGTSHFNFTDSILRGNAAIGDINDPSAGIECTRCVVVGNIVRDCVIGNLLADATTGYGNNHFSLSSGPTISGVSGGLQIGTNICGTNTTCP